MRIFFIAEIFKNLYSSLISDKSRSIFRDNLMKILLKDREKIFRDLLLLNVFEIDCYYFSICVNLLQIAEEWIFSR